MQMDRKMTASENAMSLNTENSDLSANENDEIEIGQLHQEKKRRCLVCSEDFLSAWAGERVCKKCRSSTAWRQG